MKVESKKDEGCTNETCTGNCGDNCQCKSGCSHGVIEKRSDYHKYQSVIEFDTEYETKE